MGSGHRRDSQTLRRIDGLERTLNDHALRLGRPGAEGVGGSLEERKDLAAWCELKWALDRPRDDGCAPWYAPSSAELDNAAVAKKALEKFFRSGDERRLDPLVQVS
jgi:hypothetical protein